MYQTQVFKRVLTRHTAKQKDMKNDIWLIIATCEECGLHHRTNAGEIANKVIKMLGLRNLSKYFGIDKTEVSNRITQYIYTHEF